MLKAVEQSASGPRGGSTGVETHDAQARILRSYDEGLFQKAVQEYYDYSDFANWGYWLNGARTQQEACEALMEKLLAPIPEKKGLVLDVACGKGATTRHLLKYYRPENITGINISRKQLERARKNAPGSVFLLMDATDLQFENNCFDAVVCVEAAFHFNTRLRFLSEAYRVLRTGGFLVVSDILFQRCAEQRNPLLNIQNWLRDPNAYRRLLADVGFQDVLVTDATDACWRGFYRYQFSYAFQKLRSREIDWKTFQSLLSGQHKTHTAINSYVLACGKKGGNCSRA